MLAEEKVVFRFSAKETVDILKRRIKEFLEKGKVQKLTVTDAEGKLLFEVAPGMFALMFVDRMAGCVADVVAFLREHDITISVVREEKKEKAA